MSLPRPTAHRSLPAAGRREDPTWSKGPVRGGSGRTRTAPRGSRSRRPSAGRAGVSQSAAGRGQGPPARPSLRLATAARRGAGRGSSRCHRPGAPRAPPGPPPPHAPAAGGAAVPGPAPPVLLRLCRGPPQSREANGADRALSARLSPRNGVCGRPCRLRWGGQRMTKQPLSLSAACTDTPTACTVRGKRAVSGRRHSGRAVKGPTLQELPAPRACSTLRGPFLGGDAFHEAGTIA